MRRLLFGDCASGRLYSLRDPDEPSEAEFEFDVARSLSCLYGDYHCIILGGTFRYDDRFWRPDLALVARDYSHWFVIEVELTSHSFEHHVLPQVKAFRYGEPQRDCAGILARALSVADGSAQTLLDRVPRTVAVVTNRRETRWEVALSAHDIQLLTVSTFRSAQGTTAVEVEGVLEVVTESLGFGQYSATDRSIRFAATVRLPDGQVQFSDPSGSISTWAVARVDSVAWVTKAHGVPNIPNETFVQMIRTANGRLSLRWS